MNEEELSKIEAHVQRKRDAATATRGSLGVDRNALLAYYETIERNYLQVVDALRAAWAERDKAQGESLWLTLGDAESFAREARAKGQLWKEACDERDQLRARLVETEKERDELRWLHTELCKRVIPGEVDSGDALLRMIRRMR